MALLRRPHLHPRVHGAGAPGGRWLRTVAQPCEKDLCAQPHVQDYDSYYDSPLDFMRTSFLDSVEAEADDFKVFQGFLVRLGALAMQSSAKASLGGVQRLLPVRTPGAGRRLPASPAQRRAHHRGPAGQVRPLLGVAHQRVRVLSQLLINLPPSCSLLQPGSRQSARWNAAPGQTRPCVHVLSCQRRNADYPAATLQANPFFQEKMRLLFPSYEVSSSASRSGCSRATRTPRQARGPCPASWCARTQLQVYWPLSLLLFRLNRRLQEQVEAFQHLNHWSSHYLIGLQVRPRASAV